MVPSSESIFIPNSLEQMRNAQQKIEEALKKLDHRPMDAQVRKILWDRYEESQQCYSRYANQEAPETRGNDQASGETSEEDLEIPEHKVLYEVKKEDDDSLTWTISTPPSDPIHISLSFGLEVPFNDRDVRGLLMVAGDEAVDTAVETVLSRLDDVQDPRIQGYFAENLNRLAIQRRKMNTYESNELAFEVASKLYFADAFGFLRRVKTIVEDVTPHGLAEGAHD